MSTIMTAKEARKIMGKDADKFSDCELDKLINDLDFLAHMAIKKFNERTMETKSEPRAAS